jgi:hypothetical protein
MHVIPTKMDWLVKLFLPSGVFYSLIDHIRIVAAVRRVGGGRYVRLVKINDDAVLPVARVYLQEGLLVDERFELAEGSTQIDRVTIVLQLRQRDVLAVRNERVLSLDTIFDVGELFAAAAAAATLVRVIIRLFLKKINKNSEFVF